MEWSDSLTHIITSTLLRHLYIVACYQLSLFHILFIIKLQISVHVTDLSKKVILIKTCSNMRASHSHNVMKTTYIADLFLLLGDFT